MNQALTDIPRAVILAPTQADTLQFDRAIPPSVFVEAERTGSIKTEPNDCLTSSLLGNSAVMRELREQIRKIAKFSNTEVLICGESGTGKEVVARSIHELSERKDQIFLAINCANLQPELALSDLFGHTKGSFTSAVSNRRGYFEVTNKGTLFLDEFHTLDPKVQSQILRALDSNSYTPVGSTKDIKTDVRLIFGTNQNLIQLVAEDKLRPDLFFRLPSVKIAIPALRERTEDIAVLANHFLETLPKKDAHHPKFMTLSADALETLQRHNWPGNVRQLSKVLEAAAVNLPEGQTEISSNLVSRHLGGTPFTSGLFDNFLKICSAASSTDLGNAPEVAERAVIVTLLHQTNFNISQVAKILNASRSTISRKLSSYQEQNLLPQDVLDRLR